MPLMCCTVSRAGGWRTCAGALQLSEACFSFAFSTVLSHYVLPERLKVPIHCTSHEGDLQHMHKHPETPVTPVFAVRPLQAHSAFFDHLVELVPARHYHDLDADRVSTKYMKKADREAAQAFYRKQGKQVKIAHLEQHALACA